MNIIDSLKNWMHSRHNVLVDYSLGGVFGALGLEGRNYARLIWLNICELLTDIVEQVNVTVDTSTPDIYKASAFKAFVYSWGKVCWQLLFDQGFAVIGWDGMRFWLMGRNEYNANTNPNDSDQTIIVPVNPTVEVYVMRSPTYIVENISDKAICLPWLDYLDKVMNASATIMTRLGVVILASPKTSSGAPQAAVLTDEQKKKLETDLEKDYGTLKAQHSIMLLPREMNAQLINLAGTDIKTEERVRRAVLSIADRIKVPANQIALIDANSSKSLSNGGELREGDKAKYKSARRLFERTFVQMANDLAIRMTYTIDGEPIEDAITSEGTTI